MGQVFASAAAPLRQHPKSLKECLDPLCLTGSYPTMHGILMDAISIAKKRVIPGFLTTDDVACLILYTMEGFFSLVNDALRGKNLNDLPEFAPYLLLFKSVFFKLPPMNELMFRCITKGARNYEKLDIGHKMVWAGITSCSRSQQWQFLDADGADGVLFQIFPKGHCSVDIAEYSAFVSEKECLLFPGTILEITAKELIQNPISGQNVLMVSMTAEAPPTAPISPSFSTPQASLPTAAPLHAPSSVSPPAKPSLTHDEQLLMQIGFTDIALIRSLLSEGYSVEQVCHLLS